MQEVRGLWSWWDTSPKSQIHLHTRHPQGRAPSGSRLRRRRCRVAGQPSQTSVHDRPSIGPRQVFLLCVGAGPWDSTCPCCCDTGLGGFVVYCRSHIRWCGTEQNGNGEEYHPLQHSRIHGCLHLSSAASHQHQFTPFTDSRVHRCLGQKKNKSYFFQHSQCSRIHGFTDVTDVFTCHQHLHINTSSRIHGFTDVLGRKK